jgi:hypothetical protein
MVDTTRRKESLRRGPKMGNSAFWGKGDLAVTCARLASRLCMNDIVYSDELCEALTQFFSRGEFAGALPAQALPV